jgi:hypothetical protein
MALQPFVELWPIFQFLDPVHSQSDSLDGGSARRKAATYTQNNTNAHTDNQCHRVEFEPTIPAFELLKTVHALDRAATVIDIV